MSAPIHLQGPYRISLTRRLRRAVARHWVNAAVVLLLLALVLVAAPLLAGLLSVYLPLALAG